MNTTSQKLQTRAASGSSSGPTILDLIEKQKAAIARALPKHLSADRLTRILVTEVRRNPKLAQADPTSLLGAVMQAAQLGLEPGPLGHAYLVPRYNGKTKTTDVTLQIGYRGYIDLARRSGQIVSIVAREVCDGDQFDFRYGTDEEITHRPALKDRGEAYAYYGVALLADGGRVIHVMSRDDIDRYRARSQAKDSGPWQTDYDAMARKGIALDTPIPTPFGWTTMGALAVGDEVFDMDGQRCRVTAVSEVKNIGCYRVTFANGETVTCDEEHYWLARIGVNGTRTPWRARPIAELFEAKQRGERVTMPVTGSLDCLPADLPIDPWLLGYWLGNGHSNAARVTCHADDLDEVTAAIASAGYQVGAVRRDPRSKAADVGIRKLGKALADLGVLGAKHVPTTYLRASVVQRRALLRGLVDSDGHIDKARGRTHFYSTDDGLASATAELARSLGEMVTTQTRQMTGYGHTVTAYAAEWQPVVCPAALSRKASNYREREVAPYRGVASIEQVESVPTCCIAVDSPTRTYVAGMDMVPTHNTVIRRMVPWLPLSTEMAVAVEADDHTVTLDADSIVIVGQDDDDQGDDVISAPEEPDPAEAGGDGK